ncbi:MAG: GNAT family N-acetyltransferase [Thermomicrobiales bacterium]
MGSYIVDADVANNSVAASRLVTALERNQRWWLLRVGALSGEIVQRQNGIMWFDSPNATTSMYVPFPTFHTDSVGEELDAFVTMVRGKQTPRPIWLWASEPAIPADLPLRLMARGFRHGFEPHWMWLDLANLREDFNLRREIRITFDPDLPTWNPERNTDFIAEGRLAKEHPDRACQAVAWVDGAPIGTACAFLTRGFNGIAGIYDVGVLPDYRNRGIGKALTHAVCAWARDRGYRTAGLNATPMGEPVYRGLGFQSLRWAQTWQYPLDVQALPITKTAVQFAEAIGSGDVETLSHHASLFSPLVNGPLPCKQTPMQLAAQFGQPRSGAWLVDMGGTLDLLSSWDFGWIERTREMATAHPELVNARSGEWDQTLLHEAARRGDPELIQLLIDAGADLQARDSVFGGRPLEWAEHFGKIDEAALLKAAM